jgi:hypothetical protein
MVWRYLGLTYIPSVFVLHFPPFGIDVIKGAYFAKLLYFTGHFIENSITLKNE